MHHGPRGQHYNFAHRVIPALFYFNPENFIKHLVTQRDDFLHFFWDQVGKKEQEIDRVTAEGLGCEVSRREDDTTIAIIKLPTPQAITEAYFVAAVYRPLEKEPSAKQETLTRFITLEYGWNHLEGSPRTVLCERTTHTHINYGDGPEPTLQAFSEAVCTLIENGQPPAVELHLRSALQARERISSERQKNRKTI